MKKRALILGGTGAMGTFLVEILNKTDKWDIIVTSRREHESQYINVKYIKGNAKEEKFLGKLCMNNKFDAIIDFMNYGYDEFRERVLNLVNATEHYVFLSSSRVYDYSNEQITENNNRLLDTTKDQEFLNTQRYALRKARQEDILKSLKNKNWTIIRPYITYSNLRLQLGIYEKEQWLYRLLNNKKLIIRKDILDKKTSLTYGYDVAYGISKILCNEAAYGESIHIVTEETMKWRDILNLYLDVIEENLGKRAIVYESNNIEKIEELFEGGYNTKYDRLWDRSFNNQKAEKICGKINYVGMKYGLNKCLTEFINKWKKEGNDIFLDVIPEFEKYMDEKLKEIDDYQ